MLREHLLRLHGLCNESTLKINVMQHYTFYKKNVYVLYMIFDMSHPSLWSSSLCTTSHCNTSGTIPFQSALVHIRQGFCIILLAGTSLSAKWIGDWWLGKKTSISYFNYSFIFLGNSSKCWYLKSLKTKKTWDNCFNNRDPVASQLSFVICFVLSFEILFCSTLPCSRVWM